MIGEQGGFGLVSLLRGLLGIITILGIAYAMSYDRKRIDWKLVGEVHQRNKYLATSFQ